MQRQNMRVNSATAVGSDVVCPPPYSRGGLGRAGDAGNCASARSEDTIRVVRISSVKKVSYLESVARLESRFNKRLRRMRQYGTAHQLRLLETYAPSQAAHTRA